MPGRARTGGDDDLRLRDNGISAINTQHLAWTDHEGIHVQALGNQMHRPALLHFADRNSSSDPVIALSPIRLNLVAAADGPKVLVYDIERCKIRCVLRGNGRNVTCISFASSSPDIIITGTTNGNVCVWSLDAPSRPLYHLRGVEGPCKLISANAQQSNVVATCHRSTIAIWSFGKYKPLASSALPNEDIVFISWTNEGDCVLAVSSDGRITVTNFANALKSRRIPGNSDESDDEEAFFGELEQLERTKIYSFAAEISVSKASLLGRNGLVILPPLAKVLYFYAFSLESRTLTEIWRLQVDIVINGFTFRRRNAAIEIVTCAGHHGRTFEIPEPVLDGMGWNPGDNKLGFPEMLQTKESRDLKRLDAKMKPQKPTKKRRRHVTIDKPGLRGEEQQTPRRRFIPLLPESDKTEQEAPVAKSMTSSLELPKERLADDHGSPMPFLSPSIPARKASPGPLPPLDEIVQLPPRASFNSIQTHGTQDHDSDSDDETFAEHMQGSGSFLPGGLNVPLPSTCGASFSPNGQLLTFFPRKLKVTEEREEWPLRDAQDQPDRTSAVTRLFPSFANLASVSAETDHTSGDSVDYFKTPTFAFKSSSLESPSWPARISPIKQTSSGLAGESLVTVSVRDLEHLVPSRMQLADQYRVLPGHGETSADVCNANADCAEKVNLEDTAEAWRMLSLILEERTVADTDNALDVSAIPATLLSQRPQISRNPSMASSFGELPGGASAGLLRQSMHHPFGGGWAVSQLFEWAELRADIQLLACMSTILAHAAEAIARPTRSRHLRRSSLRSESAGSQLGQVDATTPSATRVPPRVPILRTSSDGQGTSGRSPIRIQSSGASSNNPSQPTTPYLDSTQSTPPLAFSGLSRQASKLSASGSASPEHQRSSFSAQARHYAASIAEKFSYGSPNNELSSSLPTHQPGSWSKSVSFASTADPSGTSRRSLSFAQEDDGYDSDKTIEDGSLPHTPKSPGTAISFKMKQDGFFDESSFTSRDNFFPPHLNDKSYHWRRCYAEQLRSWNLTIAAAEVECLANAEHSGPVQSHAIEDAIVPQATGGRKRTTCCICYCVILAAENLCPLCFHTTHVECLDGFISTLDADSFTCPTGCGCDCSSLQDTVYELVVEPAEDQATGPLSFRKSAVASQSRLRHQMSASGKS